MVTVALLAVPAYLLESAARMPSTHALAVALDFAIFVAFLIETVLMLSVTSHPGRYLAENWLNLAILAGTGASIVGASTEWIALVRLARLAIGGMVLLALFAQFRALYTRSSGPKLVGVTVLVLAMAGALLYWLEPTITSYWDGVWLAFVTATTIGYGDFYATTAGARLVSMFVALVGFAIIALFTANIVAYFVGRDLPDAQRELQRDIMRLRDEIARLHERELAHAGADVELLRREIAELSARVGALSAQLSVRESAAQPQAGEADEVGARR
jgi:voltage-gated potassium channel